MQLNKSLVKTYLYSTSLLFAVFLVFAGYLWISEDIKTFHREAKRLEEHYINKQRKRLKTEVEKVVDYIQYKRSKAESRLKQDVKARTEEAHRIATYIYKQNKDKKTTQEIKKMIHDALFSVAWNGGDGYYFAEDMNGVEQINRNNPELEGRNIWNLQDSKGTYLVREIIAIAKSPIGEGFCSYYWNRPDMPGKLVPKISYVKYFSPLDWVIGNGKYLQEEESVIKSEIIPHVEKMNFGKNNYFFGGDWDGNILIGPYKGKNLLKMREGNITPIVQELIKMSKQGGGFFQYNMPRGEHHYLTPKLSYVQAIPEWQWFVGTGTYIDEMQGAIQKKQAVLNARIQRQTLQIVISLLVLTALAIFITRLIFAKIKDNLDQFKQFFINASTQAMTIDQKKLNFSEFKELAGYANEMIEQRQRATVALKESEQEKASLEQKLSQAHKMEAIGLMAGGVAHDLNNILSGIVGIPELLLLKLPEDSPLRKAIQSISDAGVRASDVVSDLLTVARGVASVKKPLNLNMLIDEYMNSLECRKLHALYPDIELSLTLDANLFNTTGSHIHIKKCIMNLVNNAAESIKDSGCITISTQNRYIDKPLERNQFMTRGEYAVLVVMDSGEGIPQEDLNHIFEPFYSKKELGRSGTGLGLTVVWNTMLDHQGGVTVASSKNGTAFELLFPITRKPIPLASQPPELNKFKGNGEHVLVIDDELQQREIAEEMLNYLNYNVSTVNSGEEAVNYVSSNSVDLLILDMIMNPGLNGRETFEQIIGIHPNQKAVITSGFSRTQDVNMTLDMGAAAYIKKPYTIFQLGSAVADALKG